jgi:hypothetical protein
LKSVRADLHNATQQTLKPKILRRRVERFSADALGIVPFMMSDFSGGMDELVYSVYLSSELIVIDTQTVDGPGVL